MTLWAHDSDMWPVHLEADSARKGHQEASPLPYLWWRKGQTQMWSDSLRFPLAGQKVSACLLLPSPMLCNRARPLPRPLSLFERDAGYTKRTSNFFSKVIALIFSSVFEAITKLRLQPQRSWQNLFCNRKLPVRFDLGSADWTRRVSVSLSTLNL